MSRRDCDLIQTGFGGSGRARFVAGHGDANKSPQGRAAAVPRPPGVAKHHVPLARCKPGLRSNWDPAREQGKEGTAPPERRERRGPARHTAPGKRAGSGSTSFLPKAEITLLFGPLLARFPLAALFQPQELSPLEAETPGARSHGPRAHRKQRHKGKNPRAAPCVRLRPKAYGSLAGLRQLLALPNSLGVTWAAEGAGGGTRNSGGSGTAPLGSVPQSQAKQIALGLPRGFINHHFTAEKRALRELMVADRHEEHQDVLEKWKLREKSWEGIQESEFSTRRYLAQLVLSAGNAHSPSRMLG